MGEYSTGGHTCNNEMGKYSTGGHICNNKKGEYSTGIDCTVFVGVSCVCGSDPVYCTVFVGVIRYIVLCM